MRTTTIVLAFVLVLGVVAAVPVASAGHCAEEPLVTEIRCEAAYIAEWTGRVIADLVCC